MNHPVSGVGSPAFPDARDRDRRFQVLAARERHPSTDDGVHQAVLQAEGDVTVLTVLLAPETALEWSALDQLWTTHMPGPSEGRLPDGIIGTARVYRALFDGALDQPDQLSVLIGRFPTATPPSAADAWRRRAQHSDGFLAWDLADDRTGRERRVLVLGRTDSEDELDAWLWSRGTPGLVPFTRYLVHAAKLHYELDVYEAGQSFRDLRRAIETNADILMSLHRAAERDPHRTPLTSLQAGALILGRLSADSSGLITTFNRLRDLRRTVEIAAANMTSAMPRDAPWPQGALFDRDQQLADWLLSQLDDDCGYLGATRDRAAEVAHVTGALIDQRLARHHQQLVQLQTSLIGSLLMALAAVQALEYKVPLPGPVQAPVICLLAALALGLPGAVMRWSHGAPQVLSLGGFDKGALAAIGGSLAWTASAVAAALLYHPPIKPAWTVLIVGAGAALALGMAVSLSRRRLRQRGEGGS